MKIFKTKRFFALLLALLMISASVVIVSAAEDNIPNFCIDNENILSHDEYEYLNSTLTEISLRQNCNVAVITEHSFDDVEDCAENYAASYDKTGRDGSIVLLVSAKERKYSITSTDGVGGVFNTDAREEIESVILPYLKSDDFYGAMKAFASECDSILTSFGSGERVYKKSFVDIMIEIGIALVIGIVLAFIVVFIMRGQLKSVKFQPSASNYLKDGSFRLDFQKDIFLYRTVTRTARPKDNGSSSSRSGSGGSTSGSF